MDDKTRTELEAAAFRRLVAHLQERTDVQNIDLMNLAGFCRNCLCDWYREEAGGEGIELAKPEAREIVYGMPYDEWKAKHQKEASGDQKKAYDKDQHKHGCIALFSSPVIRGRAGRGKAPRDDPRQFQI